MSLASRCGVWTGKWSRTQPASPGRCLAVTKFLNGQGLAAVASRPPLPFAVYSGDHRCRTGLATLPEREVSAAFCVKSRLADGNRLVAGSADRHTRREAPGR